MSNGFKGAISSAPPTQSLVRRMIEAATKAGLEIGTVEIAVDGTIRLHQKAEAKPKPAKGPLSWD